MGDDILSQCADGWPGEWKPLVGGSMAFLVVWSFGDSELAACIRRGAGGYSGSLEFWNRAERSTVPLRQTMTGGHDSPLDAVEALRETAEPIVEALEMSEECGRE